MGHRFRRRKWINFNKNRGLNIFIMIFVLVIISVIFLLTLFSKKTSPILMKLAEIEAKKMAAIIITQTVNSEVAESLMTNELVITTKNEHNEIVTVDFDPILLNKLLHRVSNFFINNLRCLESGKYECLTIDKTLFENYHHEGMRGIFYMIPSWSSFGVPFIANLGPKIPIRLNFIGDMITNLETEVKSYGINNVLFTVSIHVKMTQEVLVPLRSKRVTTEMNVPIAIKLIQGKVPTFYNGFIQSSPSISAPID